MYSSKDLGRLWFLYKTEGEPKGWAINPFCMSNNVARFFLEKIGRLYKLEDDYRKENLTPEGVHPRRNDAETTSIVESMRNEMFDLLAQYQETLSDLMNKVLNYLHTFWKQLLLTVMMVNTI